MRWWKRKKRETCIWVEPSDNPWGVRLLDVRPITQKALAGSQDPECAKNAVSWGGVDGSEFAGGEPQHGDEAACSLRYVVEGGLFEGVLFMPREMEDMWAVFFYRDEILFVRSWTRALAGVASCRVEDDSLHVTGFRGRLVGESQPPDFTERLLDFLIRSHVLRLIHPAPLPSKLAKKPDDAGAWCFNLFGRNVHCAAHDPVPSVVPETPVRTVTRLHTAVVRGDREAIRESLDDGLPLDLEAVEVGRPIHWATFSKDEAMVEHLVDLGADIDSVSAGGRTALMLAAESRKPARARRMIELGADVDAQDERGFSALHRAAGMGETDTVHLLLQHGADPTLIAEDGETALSLARAHGNEEIAQLLESA